MPLTIPVKVKPRARRSCLDQLPDGSWVAHLKSPPVDGKANKELIALVAEHFQCPKASIHIQSGAAGRTKLIRLETL